MQVLVVDHSGLRGRLCEAVLDKLCEDVDAAVDTMTSSIGPVVRRPDQSVCEAGAKLGLSRLPLEAGSRRLRPEDLREASRWDLVVCVDLEVLELVREMASGAGAIAASPAEGTILCMSDFLASGVPTVESARLPEELRRLVPQRNQTVEDRALVDLPRFGGAELPPPDSSSSSSTSTTTTTTTASSSSSSSSSSRSSSGEELEEQQELALAKFAAAAACTTVCCARLVAYLEAAMREHALRIYTRDLQQALRGRGAQWELPWVEVQAALQLEHDVPGGISEEERRRLCEEEVERARKGSLRTRVDVSDLGLTMDDLTGPMGGL